MTKFMMGKRSKSVTILRGPVKVGFPPREHIVSGLVLAQDEGGCLSEAGMLGLLVIAGNEI